MSSKEETEKLKKTPSLVQIEVSKTQTLLFNLFQLESSLPSPFGESDFDQKLKEIKKLLDSSKSEIIQNSSTLQRISNFQCFFKKQTQFLSTSLNNVGIGQADVQNSVDLILIFLDEVQNDLSDINSNFKAIKITQKDAFKDYSSALLQIVYKYHVNDQYERMKDLNNQIKLIQEVINKQAEKKETIKKDTALQKSEKLVQSNEKAVKIKTTEEKAEIYKKIFEEIQVAIKTKKDDLKKKEQENPIEFSKIVEKSECDFLRANLTNLKNLYNSQFPYCVAVINSTCNETMEHFTVVASHYINDLKKNVSENAIIFNEIIALIDEDMKLDDTLNDKNEQIKEEIESLKKEEDDLKKEITELSRSGLFQIEECRKNIELRGKELNQKNDQFKEIENEMKQKFGDQKGRNLTNSMMFSDNSYSFLDEFSSHSIRMAEIADSMSIYVKYFKIYRKTIENSLNYSCTEINMETFDKFQVMSYCQKTFPENREILEFIQKNNLFGQVLINLVEDHPDIGDLFWKEIPLENNLQRKTFQSYFKGFLSTNQVKTQKGMIQQIIMNINDLKF